ncbi:hypothetical protein BU16DRAFT_569487 [Lophium mytilinum]|uniref:Uncharacterized protein n=1 Tax=Lophium mytilinum TaxID=390894 RepID=A0A6A6RAN0_9PEZI|nr:hypothetical protein BU16DRAFT_569487 [Lophium mytilinum]
MAEAFIVLGIAANIAQFVSHGIKLISEGKDVYKANHGTSDEHHELEIIIEDIKTLVEEAKSKTKNGSEELPRPLSNDEKALRKLAEACEPLADKLLEILEDLKVAKDARFRGLATVRQTLRGVGKRRDIQELQQRLLGIDERLRSRISSMLQKNNHSEVLSAIKTLCQTNERMKINATLQLDQLKADVIVALNERPQPFTSNTVVLDSLWQKLAALADAGKRVEREQRILASLIFDSMKQRQEKIKDAHEQTLAWIFRKPETGFMDWLKSENGIYWVKGKAGSGKSTLMKYICGNNLTLRELHEWAGPQKLVTASYFFWNPGLPMQKSQVGLLQSLLYQILLACPVLIFEACLSHDGPWGFQELSNALEIIAKQTILPTKFCFFVDGLDEYEGDNEEIIGLLQGLTKSQNIKLCVSSRPWNAFIDAFDQSKWKLVLEDLTRDDMREYVHNLLAKDPTFARVAKQDPRCNSLVPQIAGKAHGVWLWVYLVVRDLLRDLKGEEEYPFLQRRLDSFPEELEKYFEDILGRIDKIYREETAMIFLTAVEAVRPFPVLALKYLHMEHESPDFALKLAMSPVSDDEVVSSVKRWRKLLNSRCRDLLEVNIYPYDGTFLKYKVGFLHRTVRDFLRDNYHSELRNRLSADFNARKTLCSVLIALIKALPGPTDSLDRLNQLFGLVDELLHYAREIEHQIASSNTALVNELDRVMTLHANDSKVHWTNSRDRIKMPSATLRDYGQCSFLSLAIQARLRCYVTKELEANQGIIFQKRGRPLLDYALRPMRGTLAELPHQHMYQDLNINVKMVEALLKSGSDPNQKVQIYRGESVWALFLLSCFENADLVSAHVKSTWYGAAETMVEHGADPAVKFVNQRDDAARLLTRMDEVVKNQRGQQSTFWRVFRWA